MWAHHIIDSVKVYPKNFGQEVTSLIQNATQFNLGQIINFDKIHKSAKSIYDKDDQYFRALPYDICLIEYEDFGWKKAQLVLKNPIHIIPNIPQGSLEMLVFSCSNEDPKQWSVYPYRYYLWGNSKIASAIIPEVMNGLDYKIQENWETLAQSTARTDSMALYYFLLTINCKNVYKEEVKPPAKLLKAKLRRGKVPLYSYHILKVKPFGSYHAEVIGAKDDPKNHNRLHFCRGHFKQFTPDRPLFGKFTGLYWWQAHIRGQNKNGFVDKDYEISGGQL